MKTKIPLMLFATLIFTGCAGPSARHEARVDRREDAGDRAYNRASTRHENRYDRRTDRYERVENRY